MYWLVHLALERIWRSIGNSGNLRKMEPSELKTIIRTSVRAIIHRYFFISGSGERFFKAQEKWFADLLLEWIELEKSRDKDFQVAALEKTESLIEALEKDLQRYKDEYAKLEGLDHLVINALHHKPHHSHLNLEEALAQVERIQPKQSYILQVGDQSQQDDKEYHPQ